MTPHAAQESFKPRWTEPPAEAVETGGLKASSPPERAVVWHFNFYHRLAAIIRPRRSDASGQQAAFFRARAALPAQAFVGLLAPGAAP